MSPIGSGHVLRLGNHGTSLQRLILPVIVTALLPTVKGMADYFPRYFCVLA